MVVRKPMLLERLYAGIEVELAALGYVRKPRPEGCSFQQKQSDEVHFLVNVKWLAWANAFGVSFLELRRDRSGRQSELEQFAGIRDYSFEGNDPDEVVDRALADFRKYFPAWRGGQDSARPSTSEQLAREYDDLSVRGREAFRQGRYADALQLFRSAAGVRKPSAVDERFAALAEERVRSR